MAHLRSKYRDSGHMFAITTWSFGISVCLFIFGGVCMNPALALCQAIVGLIPWSSVAPFAIAEMLGGVAGACIAWLIYADNFRASEGEVDGVAIRPPNKIAATDRPALHTTATIASDETTTERNPMINHLCAEFASTAHMIVFGVGEHCDITHKGRKYRYSGHIFAITTWSCVIIECLFIFGGVCMNPAMALCQAIVGLIPWSSVAPFAIAEMLGGVAGACIAWLIYAVDFRASEGEVDGVAIRNIFSTNPTPESYNLVRNFCIEAFATFVFLTGILAIAAQAGDNHLALGIGVGLLVWAVGMGLGGVTGFAMNHGNRRGPARLGRGHGPGRRDRLRHEPGARPRPPHRLPAAAYSQQGGQQLALRPGGARHRPVRRRRRCRAVHHFRSGHRVLTEALPHP